MTDIKCLNLSFERLPFWKGIVDAPEDPEFIEFSLGWDPRGFIRQTTSQEIQDMICRIYADEKYNFITDPPGASEWANRLGDAKIATIIDFYGELNGKTVLEIGAGSLYIAEKLVASHGVRNYIVVDPAVKDTPVSKNIQVMREYFTEGTKIAGDIDLVLSFNCLEHVSDPVGLLRNVRRILSASGGKGIFLFPDVEDQFNRGDLNAILHEHINYFTSVTAIKIMGLCGLNVIKGKTEYDALRLLVETGNASCDDANADVQMLQSFFTDSMRIFNNNLKDFTKHIGSHLAAGKRVAFHGATNGLNNILALSGLADKGLITIFDGDESKTGKYLPACNNPIRHSKDPIYAVMDEVYIAATTFYSEIREFLITFHRADPVRLRPLFPFES